MIEGTYGIYYNNMKEMLRENGLDPSKISRIYLPMLRRRPCRPQQILP